MVNFTLIELWTFVSSSCIYKIEFFLESLTLLPEFMQFFSSWSQQGVSYSVKLSSTLLVWLMTQWNCCSCWSIKWFLNTFNHSTPKPSKADSWSTLLNSFLNSLRFALLKSNNSVLFFFFLISNTKLEQIASRHQESLSLEILCIVWTQFCAICSRITLLYQWSWAGTPSHLIDSVISRKILNFTI